MVYYLGRDVAVALQTESDRGITAANGAVTVGTAAVGTAAKLGNPKIAELAREIEKAGVGALVKDQISAPGVKAGTPQAAVAKKVVSKAAQAQGATA